MHCSTFDFEAKYLWVFVSFCFENIHIYTLIYVWPYAYSPSHFNHKSMVVDQSMLFAAVVQYHDLQQVPKEYSKVNRTNVISEVTVNVLNVYLLK